jgi:hypothetical protein
MIGVRLKDLCNQYGVFIMSATQLNSSYQTAQQHDQNLLRGAKSLGDWTKFINVILNFFIIDSGIIPKSNLKEFNYEKNYFYTIANKQYY